MASYADKPWLKSYKIGAFKLKQTIDYPEKPLFSILDEIAEKFPGKRIPLALPFQSKKSKT